MSVFHIQVKKNPKVVTKLVERSIETRDYRGDIAFNADNYDQYFIGYIPGYHLNHISGLGIWQWKFKPPVIEDPTPSKDEIRRANNLYKNGTIIYSMIEEVAIELAKVRIKKQADKPKPLISKFTGKPVVPRKLKNKIELPPQIQIWPGDMKIIDYKTTTRGGNKPVRAFQKETKSK